MSTNTQYRTTMSRGPTRLQVAMAINTGGSFGRIASAGTRVLGDSQPQNEGRHYRATRRKMAGSIDSTRFNPSHRELTIIHIRAASVPSMINVKVRDHPWQSIVVFPREFLRCLQRHSERYPFLSLTLDKGLVQTPWSRDQRRALQTCKRSHTSREAGSVEYRLRHLVLAAKKSISTKVIPATSC